MRWRLTVAYDGRGYAGWQCQPGGNTVQNELEAAVRRILQTAEKVAVTGSGRTDAGVHALGQVAHFDAPQGCRMDGAAWVRALNGHLPPAVRVMAAVEAGDGWHARFDAAGKTYVYRVWTGAVRPPLEAGLAWHVPQSMDRGRLEEACRLCEGTRDFRAFAANRGDGKDASRDTVRTVWSVRPVWQGEVLALSFHGSGFLYKMVRLLTGAIMRTARGQESLEWLTGLLSAAGGKCRHTAPPDGLYLVSVDYDDLRAQ